MYTSLNNVSLKTTNPTECFETSQMHIDDTGNLDQYVKYFGPFVADSPYLEQYTMVVKFVMWCVDIQIPTKNAYRWRYKPKK